MILVTIFGLVLCIALAVQALRPEPHNCHGCVRCRSLHVGGQP